ncbi:MAG: LptF/LptG family permease [Pseudomonadales bacterium]
MTSVLSRYLVRGLFGGCVLLLLTLVALFSVFALIEEVDDVGKGAYTILDALAVVALNAPTLALEMAPFAAMLGTVYGLAQFIRSNELLAVRVAGFSPAWVMFRCAVAAVLFAGVLVGVEMASRPLGKDAITYRLSKLQPDGELLARSGYWYRQGDKFVNVASYRRDTEPRGILQFEFDGIELKQSLFARTATARQGEEWALDEVVQNRLDSMARVERSTQATLAWQPPWGALDEVLNFPIVSLTSEELYKATRRHAPRRCCWNGRNWHAGFHCPWWYWRCRCLRRRSCCCGPNAVGWAPRSPAVFSACCR